MKYPTFALAAIVGIGFTLFSVPGWAQSKEDGIRLYNEALKLDEAAKNEADMKKAAEKYEKALKIYEKVGYKAGIGKVANNLGILCKVWGRYDKAVECFEKSLAICRELKDQKSEGQSLNNLGLVLARRGEYDKAAEHYEKSLAIFRELKDRKSEGQALNNLGNVFVDWGHYKKAVECYEKSFALAVEFKGKTSEAHALNNLGSVFARWGQHDKAVDFFMKSLAISRGTKDKKGQGQTLNNLGIVFARWGQHDKAVEFYEKSLAIARDLKDKKGEGESLNNLGNEFQDLGQHDKAVEYYEKSLAIKRELKDKNGQGATLNNLGKIYAHGGEHAKALESFEEGLRIWKDMRVPARLASFNIGMLYLDMGEMEKAERPLKEGNYLQGLGRRSLLNSDYQEAVEVYGKLLRGAEKNRNSDNLFASYTGLGYSYEGLGDNTKAEEYFRKAVDVTEELRSSLSKGAREKFFDVRIYGFYRTAPYEGLARVLTRMQNRVEAFKGSEYTKARIFAEGLTRFSEGSAVGIPSEVVRKDEQINDQLAALKKTRRQAYEKANEAAVKVLNPQIDELESHLRTHIKMLRDKYPLFASVKYPEPADLAQTALKDNEWVLSYDVTDSGVLIYLARGKNLIRALFKALQREKIDQLVERFRKPLEVRSTAELADKLFAFNFDAGKELADILVSDILSDLPPGVPLIVVPDDSLGLVPFEMLVLSGSGRVIKDAAKPSPGVAINGDVFFFSERNPISYQHSVTALTLARIHREKKKPGDRTLVMADPVFTCKDDRAPAGCEKGTPSRAAEVSREFYSAIMGYMEERGLVLGRLKSTGYLAECLQKMFPGRADVYTGLKASKQTFSNEVARKLHSYGNVVFATHGFSNKDTPVLREPCLILTTVPKGVDGFLRMSEVMGFKMNADVVALEACQTGVGKVLSGEGTMAMGRAFQHAGAKSVLMSLWNVYEDAGTKLTESFLQHREEGKSKLEALQLARKELRAKGYDHPFFWAAFILVGEVD